MQRPIVFITLLFICGIYLGSLTKIPVCITLCAGGVSWVFCFLCFYFKKYSICLISCLSVFLVAVSMAYYDSCTDIFSPRHCSHVFTARKSMQRISGVIVEPPLLMGEERLHIQSFRLPSGTANKNPCYKISFTIYAKEIETVAGWKPMCGYMKVNLYVKEEDFSGANNPLQALYRLVYGQEIEFFGYIFLPKSPTNPGEFNYKNYLLRQIPSISCLATVIHSNNIKFKKLHPGNWINCVVYSLKRSLNNLVYMHAFSKSAPMISSVLLGYRADLSNEVVDDFMKTGIIHFIAISGFNVGIIVFAVLLPLRITGVNQVATTGIVLIIVGLYAFLTGLSPPVLRASIMVIVFLCSFLVRRQWDITSGIFVAVFFILFRNPSDLFNVGFQLSVLATMGIVYGPSKIEGVLFRTAVIVEALQVKEERGRFFFLKKYFRKSICVSLAAWLATLPLTAWYFHLFTPFVPIINIVVFPLFWIIIVCGFALLTLGTICSFLADIAAWLASQADIALESLVSAIVSLPYSYFYIAKPPLTGIVVYYLLILFLFYHRYLVLDIAKIIIWGLISANILVFSAIVKYSHRPFTVTCLDVGHGSAMYIQFPNGKNILYDVGSWQNYDAGKYIVSPFLWDRHIKKIDLLIISHEHEDHWNGLCSVIERFNVKSVYVQPYLKESMSGKRLCSLLEKHNIHTIPLFYGMILKGFEPAVVKVLNPHLFAEATTINDNSCVLKIDDGKHSILLCADIQEDGIESIMSRYSELNATIIQVPHHGSFANNLERLIQAVSPRYALINSSETVTNQKTIDTLKRYDIAVFQTHKEGAITLQLHQHEIKCFIFGKEGICLDSL